MFTVTAPVEGLYFISLPPLSAIRLTDKEPDSVAPGTETLPVLSYSIMVGAVTLVLSHLTSPVRISVHVHTLCVVPSNGFVMLL